MRTHKRLPVIGPDGIELFKCCRCEKLKAREKFNRCAQNDPPVSYTCKVCHAIDESEYRAKGKRHSRYKKSGFNRNQSMADMVKRKLQQKRDE